MKKVDHGLENRKRLPLRSASTGSAFHLTPAPMQVSGGWPRPSVMEKTGENGSAGCYSAHTLSLGGLCCCRHVGPELPGLLILESSSQNLNIGDYKGRVGWRRERLGVWD